ncbi:MAG: PilZ domain-containing protein [Planctomycetota bacterium]
MSFQDVVVYLEEDGVRHEGRISSVWHGEDGVRMAVDFTPDSPPVLPIGRAVLLGFRGGQLEVPIEAIGRINYRHDGESSHVYHLRFGQKARHLLGPMIEPREALRVFPGDRESIEILLTPPKGAEAIACYLRDISVTGLGVAVPLGHEAALAKVREVHLSFELNGEQVEVDGRIRNRGVIGSGIHYGIEFVPQSLVSDPERKRIVGYVEGRLRSMAAAARPRRESVAGSADSAE